MMLFLIGGKKKFKFKNHSIFEDIYALMGNNRFIDDWFLYVCRLQLSFETCFGDKLSV